MSYQVCPYCNRPISQIDYYGEITHRLHGLQSLGPPWRHEAHHGIAGRRSWGVEGERKGKATV